MVLLFLLSNIVIAKIDVKIEIKDSFIKEENVLFDYTILSDKNLSILVIPYIDCPSAPIPQLIQKEIKIKENSPYKEVYYGFTIEESIEPQTCTAYVQILSPFEQIFSKDFKITTNPSFSFETKTCKDSECSEITKVFVKDENIYLDYSSSVESPSVTTLLTYPDKTTKQLTLPASIKAEQIGNYELEIIASKQGYKTITKKELFGVIEKEAVIKPKEFRGDKYTSYLLYFLVTILLIALVYITRKMGGISALGIRTSKSEVTRINSRINNAKILIRQGNINAATSEYLEITKLYEKLPLDKKKIVYRNLQELYTMIK